MQGAVASVTLSGSIPRQRSLPPEVTKLCIRSSTQLNQKKRVGHRNGLPLVEHPDDVDTDVKLGESVDHLYEHYPNTDDDLYLPAAGEFLDELMKVVDTVDEAADEAGVSVNTLRRAMDLHGINPPEPSERDDSDDDSGGIRLPSGEVAPWGPTSPLVVAQLLSDGMSYTEAARYLSRESGESVTAEDIREVTESLDGEATDGVESRVPRGKTQSGSDGYQSTPW